jgi:large subunit ribosomal protein L13
LKTYSAKAHEVESRWYVVDAGEVSLGRLASRVATILQGKHKPTYTPSLDVGDHVVVINADHLRLTGTKADTKIYQRFTGYPSGRRERTAREQMSIDSTEIVRLAVKGMLPKSRLGRQMIKKLKVYKGTDHPHAAQQPETLSL